MSGAPSLHKPWHPAGTANAATALTLPSFHAKLPISPWSRAAVPRPSQSCVVPAAAWLLLSSIHTLGAWRSHIHCQEQLGPPSRRWELVVIINPGLWKYSPVTWLKTCLSTCILGECKGWKCFVYVWALIFLHASPFQGFEYLCLKTFSAGNFSLKAFSPILDSKKLG